MEKLSPNRFSRREILKGVTVIVGSALGLEAVACRDYVGEARVRQSEILEKMGMNGEHPVIDIRSVPGFSQRGDVNGGFLSFTGEFEGKTTTILQFAWKMKEVDKTIQISQIPFEKVQFKIADPETKPTVRFELDTQKLLKPPLRGTSEFVSTESVNLNDYVAVSRLAVISLSEQDYVEFRNPRK